MPWWSFSFFRWARVITCYLKQLCLSFSEHHCHSLSKKSHSWARYTMSGGVQASSWTRRQTWEIEEGSSKQVDTCGWHIIMNIRTAPRDQCKGSDHPYHKILQTVNDVSGMYTPLWESSLQDINTAQKQKMMRSACWVHALHFDFWSDSLSGWRVTQRKHGISKRGSDRKLRQKLRGACGVLLVHISAALCASSDCLCRTGMRGNQRMWRNSKSVCKIKLPMRQTLRGACGVLLVHCCVALYAWSDCMCCTGMHSRGNQRMQRYSKLKVYAK